MMTTRAKTRGFTIVEMMISMSIMGLVLALAIIEFVMVFNHNSLMTADLSADQNGRIVMARVTNELREGMPDVTDYTGLNTPPPIVSNPTPAASAAPVQSITFWRVHSGSGGLDDPVAIPTDPNGNPAPCYDQVTLTYDPAAHTITKTVTLKTNVNCATPQTTTNIVASNVSSFQATAPSTNLIDIDLQTTDTKGGSIYDLNSQVAVGSKP
jgi:prepilin-type N-terminal cleavage/methylation domain-containing protein